MASTTAKAVALGIDVGTGSTKAGLVDGDGRLLSVGRSGHQIRSGRAGWSESDPQDWLTSARSAIAEALVSVGCAVEVVAVGLSGQMHGVVLCRSDGSPIRPAVLWSDRRSSEILDELRCRFTPDELRRLANPIVAGMAGPSIASLTRVAPELVTQIDRIVQAKDWLRLQLTGEVATDPSDASATLLWDAEANGWMPEALEVFGVHERWLPRVRASADTGGFVSAVGAERFGLQAGLPVAVGAADTAAALLGAGVRSGEVQVSTGTGGQIARPSSERPLRLKMGVHLFRSADDEGWYEMAAIQNAGIAIDWALGILNIAAEEIPAAVAASPPGANGVSFLPYLTGERTPHLDATLTGGWSGLRPTTGRADLIRSVFEGVAFSLRDGLDALGGRTGKGFGVGGSGGSALLAGGGSTAHWWQQMLADVLNVSLIPHDAADASVRGAGLLALAAIGDKIAPREAVKRGVAIDPRSGQQHLYAVARERFLDAFPAARAEVT